MENYIKNQIIETAGNFKRLASIYNKWNFNETMCFHLIESANAFENMMGVQLMDGNEQKQLCVKIRKKLASRGIKTGEYILIYHENHRIKIVISAWLKSGCQKAEIVCNILSEILEKNMRVSGNSRMIISTMENEYVFEETPCFYELHGGAIISKKKGEISGDAYTFLENRNNQFVMAISDGMGTGERAAKDSGEVMDFVEEYVEAGFCVDKIPYIINEALMKSEEDTPVTVDISIIDMDSGKLKMIKSGGATTFIKRKDKVKVFCPSSLPLGVLKDVKPYIVEENLEEGDYVIMISDGVADCLPFYDKEKQLSKIIEETKENNPEKMASAILDECRYYNGIKNNDDMTVLVAGIWKIKNLHWKK